MGYDSGFLGIDVPLPEGEGVVLGYEHFTVTLDTERRLASVTAVNLDGAAIVDVPRLDDWRFDPRVPEEQQTGPGVYAANELDRGHLVRRRDPAWGPDAEAAASDTFHYTNAAPQSSAFNQSKELWLGLEDHVLAFAEANRERLNVFTAPILAAEDPLYRGIGIPVRFWKVAAWADGDELAAAGFVLEQAGLPGVPTAGADLEPFRTFQVPIAEIEELSGVRMPQLAAADRMPTLIAPTWRELHEPSDIQL